MNELINAGVNLISQNIVGIIIGFLLCSALNKKGKKGGSGSTGSTGSTGSFGSTPRQSANYPQRSQNGLPPRSNIPGGKNNSLF